MTLPFTVILLGLAGYWILVSFGIFDLSDADAELDATPGPLGSYLHFLNVGEVPLLVILSTLNLTTWVCGILANTYLNPSASILLGLGYLVPAFLISTVVTRYATMPLRGVFRLLNAPNPTDRTLVGQTCVVRTREANATYGQGEVASDGAPLTVQIRTHDGTSLPLGTTALIVSGDPATSTYLVRPVTASSLDQ